MNENDQHDPNALGAPQGASANPYAPPAASDATWDPATDSVAATTAPPTSVPKVFGVLSIVFGSLMLLGGLIGTCTGFLGKSLGQLGSLGTSGPQAEMMQTMMKHLGSIYTAMGVQSLLFTAMSGWLLAVGIGQLRYRRWACRWSVYWGGVALVVLVGMMLIAFLWIGPAYSAMFEDISRSAPSGAIPQKMTSAMSGLFGGTSGVMTAVFYGPYPVLLLIYFTRDRIRAAMTR